MAPAEGNKHGARQDDRLARETGGHVQGGHSPRVEEWREPEPPAEGEPEPAELPEDQAVGGTPPGMDPEGVAGRSRLARYLRRSTFPADRDGVIAVARANEAPDDVLAELDDLPGALVYRNATDVWAALGHGTERDDGRF